MDDCIALGADIFLYTRDESRFLRWKESRAKMKLEARKLCRIFNRNVRLYSGCGDTHAHTRESRILSQFLLTLNLDFSNLLIHRVSCDFIRERETKTRIFSHENYNCVIRGRKR